MPYVALDSGHGKTTAGKRSFDGTLLEYEFNHDVTNRIKYHLERHGVKVLLTSPNAEIDEPLNVRCNRANNEEVDILVSIHANAWGDSWNTANGWEIFTYDGKGESLRLAKEIEKESIPFLNLKNRGLKTANFTMLGNTKMPAVLIEHGFYTNKLECFLLKTDEFREKCAIADSKGILNYFGIRWIEDMELTSANDIVWELAHRGIVTDKDGMIKEMEKEPNGRLYWLARKTVAYFKSKNV